MNIIEELKKEYHRIFSIIENRPGWAVKKIESDEIVLPSIPFVGKNYDETKILLYASAENLRNYYGQLDDNSFAINRHRFWFDKSSDKLFFPNVHIGPINDGGLVNIMAYIATKTISNIELKSPKDFLEKVAFGNFGKFSIKVEDKQNKDYAHDRKKLLESFEYIKSDLNILKPKILILPKTIYGHYEIRSFIKKEYPEIKIIPIYQIQQNNISNKNRLQQYRHKDKNELGILNEWQENFAGKIKGKINENFYSFYTYLDEKLNEDK